jgi:hydrogenase expression/formation protein HypD
MNYRDEYRDANLARTLADRIAAIVTRPWTLMEVCGGQTHAIVRFGIDELLPPNVTLLHGPGCPVCVTPVEYVDKAIEIARRPETILCSFGDMLRVPGSTASLAQAKAAGADVRIVYSPLDALAVATRHPEREVVFFAVGFETTAPANAMLAHRALRDGVANLSLLVSHVLVPPALHALLDAPGNRVQGFLAAGHVCTIAGTRAYEPIAAHYRVPIVVTGFEPIDILHGVYLCVRQLEERRAVVENAYSRSVRADGNVEARALVDEVFTVVTRRWRGIGDIGASGLALADAYRGVDAEARFSPVASGVEATGECIAGLVLRGERKPPQCPAFGTRCTPAHPLGVTMVSSEGACAAYYRYRGGVAARS